MELQEIREEILNVPVFKGLPEAMHPRLLTGLLSIARTRQVTRGDFLFLQGERETDTGCLLLQGAVEVRRDGETPVYVQAPDILGEMRLFTPQGQRTATVEVTVGGVILEFQWGAFGIVSRHLFDKQELTLLKKAIVDCAWKRGPDLFSRRKPAQTQEKNSPKKSKLSQRPS